MELKTVLGQYQDYIGKEVTISGWIRNHRKQKEFGFIDLHDGSCFKTIQCVYANELENFADIENATLSHHIQQASSSWYQQLWTLNAQWQKSIYSSPDSTGRQYVQSVETLNSQSEGKNEKKDTVYVEKVVFNDVVVDTLTKTETGTIHLEKNDDFNKSKRYLTPLASKYNLCISISVVNLSCNSSNLSIILLILLSTSLSS